MQHSFITCCVVLSVIRNVHRGNVADKDLTLSISEKQSLDQLKRAMEPFLPEEKKREVYLIRYLRLAKFNPKKAQELLFKDLEWRKSNNIDNIRNEDWSDFERNYEYFITTVDKQGQPVLTSEIGRWDFRKAIVSGKQNRMLRYFYKLFEDMEAAILKAQNEGTLVTRGIFLYDMKGYGIITHACPRCIAMYVTMIQAFDSHYPGLLHKVYLVNAPNVFETLLRILRPIMTPETRELLNVYGTNRREWIQALKKDIDEEELPVSFGGKNNEIPSDYF